jgi:hypothetical protein
MSARPNDSKILQILAAHSPPGGESLIEPLEVYTEVL